LRNCFGLACEDRAARRAAEARVTGTTTKSPPGLEFLIHAFKQPITPSLRVQANAVRH